MLKFEYSKNTRYLLGKDTDKYYIVDTDSNGILRFFINPSNYYKNIYPITSVEYDKLKKEKITAKDLGIGGVTLLISGSFIGGSLYKMLQALNIKIDINILVFSLAMFPLVFFYQKVKDYAVLKTRDISLNKKEGLIAKVIFINEKSRNKIKKGNMVLFGFIALLVFMIFDVSSRSNDIATMFIGLFAAVLLFYRHRLFAIGLTEGQDILVEIEKNTE